MMLDTEAIKAWRGELQAALPHDFTDPEYGRYLTGMRDLLAEVDARDKEIAQLRVDRDDWAQRANSRIESVNALHAERSQLAEELDEERRKVDALRERLTVTPEMVKRAIEGAGKWQRSLRKDDMPYVWWDNEAIMRAALLAAGMEEKP